MMSVALAFQVRLHIGLLDLNLLIAFISLEHVSILEKQRERLNRRVTEYAVGKG